MFLFVLFKLAVLLVTGRSCFGIIYIEIHLQIIVEILEVFEFYDSYCFIILVLKYRIRLPESNFSFK